MTPIRDTRPLLLASPTRRLIGVLLLGLLTLLGGCRSVLFAGLNSTDQHRDIAAQHGVVFDPANHLALEIGRASCRERVFSSV